VFVPAPQTAADRHAESGREGRARVSSAVAIVFALGAEQKTVQALVLPHCCDAIEAPGKHFVDVTLVTNVEHEPVPRRFEDAVQGDRELDDAEVRPEM